MIVGTAGHIDHGKTSLVRALSGVDTDRLPEERARGISIDLGYAYVPVDEACTLGYVDVPGHEKFVHTMLAGATGIDFLLLVVAADDGVMPQTREHLTIAAILGIREGAIAITKVDAVDEARVLACEDEVRALVEGTPLSAMPLFRVSAKSGAGVQELDAHLRACALRHRRDRGSGSCRLAVDRSFTLAGIGTVVTGTLHSGEVRVGDRLVVAPSGLPVRVRGLRAQGREAEAGVAGQRCALNLAPVSREQVARGDWIVAPSIALATDRFDATLRFVQGAAPPRSGTPVHVHVAAAHAMGRLVPLDGDFVQIVLQSTIAAWRGDRFVIRDASATHTLGGGTIVDPMPPLRYRRTEGRLAALRALAQPDARAQLAALVDVAADGVDVAAFARTGNIGGASAMASSLEARHHATPHADHVIGHAAWDAHADAAVTALDKFHRAHPDLLGVDRARLRRMAFPRLAPELAGAIADAIVADGLVRETRGLLHLASHDNALSPAQRSLVDAVLPRLREGGLEPPWVRDMSAELGILEDDLRRALVRAAKRGEVHQVVRDLFYHPEAIARLASCVSELEREHGNVTAASFRDKTGLGRKRAIQILEYFDRAGYTRRVRDQRLVRGDARLAEAQATQ